jgi:hypothetical protein
MQEVGQEVGSEARARHVPTHDNIYSNIKNSLKCFGIIKLFFLIKERVCKKKIIKNKKKQKFYSTYIQYQFYNREILLINILKIIRFGYKSFIF